MGIFVLFAQFKETMTREEFLLKKKELNRQFRLKVDELEQKYIEESGLAGKKILYWNESYSGRFLSETTVKIFKICSVSVGADSEFWIDETKDIYELGIEFSKDSKFREVSETYVTIGGEDSSEGIEFTSVAEIDDSDFEEVVKIFKKNNLKEDKEVALEAYYEISRYLRKAGYRPE